MSPDVAASVRARLLNHARQLGEEFERTLARYAGERLLFRLGASAARDRCILKVPHQDGHRPPSGGAIGMTWSDQQRGCRRPGR